MTDQPTAPTSSDEGKKGGNAKWWLINTGAFLALFYAFCGFYTVQPIGALPDGATAIVWRESGEPFFNSADALCLERTGGVSSMCRGMAKGQPPKATTPNGKFYTGILADFDNETSRFTMKPDVAAAFGQQGLKGKLAC